MPLVLIILVGVAVSGSATTVSTSGNLYNNVCVDDKAFSQDVIFEQPTTSAVHCAAICKQQEGCVTFTFDQEVCRGHTVLVTPSTPSTPAPGARSFTRDSARATWVGTACVSDSDCSQDDTTCFYNTCVCTPGFYYSICSDTCVSECPPGKLAQSYTKYKDRYIEAHNDKDTPDTSVEECLDFCTADPDCVSIDFGTAPSLSDNLCRMSYSVATSPGVLFATSTASTVFDHYQRQCQ